MNITLLILLILCIIVIGILYAKMILIHGDVMKRRHERIVNDWKETHKLYLQIVTNHGEKPIENVTFNQMQKRINQIKNNGKR